jgi:hypothetical protein
VNVTGEPKLLLNSGGVAKYSSGDGGNVLNFSYKVRTGQNSAHLDYRSIKSLIVHGGAISDTAGNPLNLTLPAPGSAGSLGANSNISIDTIAPAVVSYSVLFGVESFNSTNSVRRDLPWQITGIRVTFSKPIASGDIRSLTGVNVTDFSGLGTNTLIWRISRPSDGTAVTSLATSGEHALKDSAGNPLNGGAKFKETLNFLLGDFNDDGVVNRADIMGIARAERYGYNIFADINGDGIADHRDVKIVALLIREWRDGRAD